MTLGVAVEQVDEPWLERTLSRLVQDNTQWLLTQPSVPKSVGALGLQWCPDRAGIHVVFQHAPVLIEQGRGSCGSIAALAAAIDRTKSIRRGVAPHLAARRASVKLVRRANGRVVYWHALVRRPRELYDPCMELRQVCPTPAYA